MESSDQIEQEEMVRLTIELPVSTVAWLDNLRLQMGVRSRGFIIEQLLGELGPEADPGNQEVA